MLIHDGLIEDVSIAAASAFEDAHLAHAPRETRDGVRKAVSLHRDLPVEGGRGGGR